MRTHTKTTPLLAVQITAPAQNGRFRREGIAKYPKGQKEWAGLTHFRSLPLSEVISSFMAALEMCHSDSEALLAATSHIGGPTMELVTSSKKHARELLNRVYEVTARLGGKEGVSASDLKSLEDHVRVYYDGNDVGTVSRMSMQTNRHHLEEATKLFALLKPHLTVNAVEKHTAALAPTSRRVFIVHGRDEENKKGLKDMLVRWGFDPIILSEQANRGRHLLEKLLKHTSDVGFAFVLMTPDDVAATRDDFGRLIVEVFEELVSEATGKASSDRANLIRRLREIFRPRVRQNVMFEYGLCIATLGKENVCVLVGSEGLEIPSDVLGYSYLRFEKTVSECEQQIMRELEAAGYDLPKK